MEWLDDLNEDDLGIGDESLDTFYCPYTNSARCALLIKGWQPQELCDALDCNQLRFVHTQKQHKREAA